MFLFTLCVTFAIFSYYFRNSEIDDFGEETVDESEIDDFGEETIDESVYDNTVQLLSTWGGDLTHAGSAWCSTSTHVENNKDRIPGLLKTLATNGHGTPFEKSAIHFLVKTDIGTHIQLLKHRTLSINAESARYKEIKDNNYYIPKDFPECWREKLEEHTKKGLELYHSCCTSLTPLLGRARAKESSRYFRNYNTQITSDIVFNFRNFMHFFNLRSDKNAQKEIQDIANKMMDQLSKIPEFQYSIAAFEKVK